jgi:hypothetical protein
MFSQNPAQALTIRFALILVFTTLLFNAVHPVFAATEMALSGGDISSSGVFELVETLQSVGGVGRYVIEVVSSRLGW